MMVLLLWLCFARAVGADMSYSSLAFDYSADTAEVPSRALLVSLNVGAPTQRKRLMVDFSSDRIELSDCIKQDSYTYDVNRTTDVILFEEEQITDHRARAVYRVPVQEHCEDIGKLGERYYKNCLSRQCRGIAGLSRRSPLWDVWTALTYGLDGLKLGASHPSTLARRRLPSAPCMRDTEGLCDIDANVTFRLENAWPPETGASWRVRVQFHAENSYIYVPADIYDAYRKYKRPISLVFARARDGKPLLQLPSASLVHEPRPWEARGATSRSSSTLMFSHHTRSTRTLLLKPWDSTDTVSLGNRVLEHYTLHVDLLRDNVVLEQRLRQEHLGPLGLAMAVTLFFLLVRSVALSVHEMAWLASRLPIQCPCHRPRAHNQSRDVRVDWALDAVILVLATVAAIRAAPFVEPGAAHRLFLYGTFALNWCLALGLLALPFRWHRGVHVYGIFALPHYVQTFVHALMDETLLLQALFFLLVVVRQDSMATFPTVCIGLFALFNCWRYVLYWVAMWPDGTLLCFSLALAELGGVAFYFLLVLVLGFVGSVALALALGTTALLVAGFVVDHHAHHACSVWLGQRVQMKKLN